MLPFEYRSATLLKVGTHDRVMSSLPTRSIDELKTMGVLAINKPKGPTSHQVSEYVQRILGIDKAGHGGTLDPPVTGVLPVALGKGTRVVQALLPAGKEYVCLMRLHEDRPVESIRGACKQVVGEIEQVPPVRSAVKRQLRTRTIYYLEVLEIDGRDVLYRVGCQAGTYIRKLCEQIGEKLSCKAHMQQLVRTKSGPFDYAQTVTLEELEDAVGYAQDGDEEPLREMLLPIEAAVSHLPTVVCFPEVHRSVKNGVDVKVPGVAFVDSDIEPGMFVALRSTSNELLALGEAGMSAKDICEQPKGVAFITKKVFLE